MASEIRVNQIQNRSGLTTTTFTDTGVTISGILTVSDDLNVGGVVTYEDVTNIDAIGIVTARSGLNVVGNDLNVGSNIKLGNASGIVTATTFSGSGASLTNLNASNIASGTVPTARLGSGTASSSTFLAGDSTYKTVTGTTINNNANNRLITGSGTANTLEGEANLQWDGETLYINRSSNSVEGLSISNSNNSQGSAAAQLNLSGGDNSYANVRLECNGTSHHIRQDGSGNLKFYNNTTERLRITNTGQVGIGDNSPDRELVVKNASSNATIKIEASNSHTSQLFFSDTDAEGVARISVFHGSGSDQNSMIFDTGGASRLAITSDGKVGVGLITPANYGIHAEQSSQSVYYRADSGSVDSIYGSATALGYAIAGTTSNHPFVFFANNAEKLRINTAGDVLIPGNQATSSETGKLDIYHSADGDINNPHIRLWGTTNADPRIEFGSPTNSGEGGYIMYNDSDEALYIGSRMATYSEVNICTGMNDGDPASNIRFSVSSVGNVTKPVQPGFECSNPDSYNTSGSPSNYVTSWTRIHHNYGSHFNGNNGRFTAPVNGRYLFTVHMTNVAHSSPHVAFGINGGTASGPSRSGTNYTELWHIGSDSGDGVNLTHIFDLSANDYVNVWLYGYTGTADDPRCYFAGYLLG